MTRSAGALRVTAPCYQRPFFSRPPLTGRPHSLPAPLEKTATSWLLRYQLNSQLLVHCDWREKTSLDSHDCKLYVEIEMRFLPTILATILLPATASAGLLQGIGSHHAALHAKLKRANLVERDVVTVTEFEYVVVTVTAFVDESTTIVGTPVATSVIKPSPASPTPAAPSAEVPTPSPAAAAPPPPPPPPAPPSPPSPPPPPPPAPPAPVEAPAQTTPNALFNSGSGAGYVTFTTGHPC